MDAEIQVLETILISWWIKLQQFEKNHEVIDVVLVLLPSLWFSNFLEFKDAYGLLHWL